MPSNPEITRRCSFASAIAGSQAGCANPVFKKYSEATGVSRWRCQTCGYVFSALIKEMQNA